MAEKYSNKKDEMIASVLNPVKVDPDYPSTPKPSTSENEMGRIVEDILEAPK